jgi:phosphoadenosine phosphosulfate reductase
VEQGRIKQLSRLSLNEKIDKSKQIISEGLQKCSYNDFYVAWTGGKDSTTMLWLYSEVSKENGQPLPKAFFINEGSVFEEIFEFVNNFRKLFKINLTYVKNSDVIEKVKNCGDMICVDDLNERNQSEIRNLGYTDQSFLFEPESLVCNHLTKTVAMNDFIEKNDIKIVSTAIRWDEQEARKSEEYFSKRKSPDHVRMHPMLHFKERDIWNIIHKNNIPFCSLYTHGYRSLGTKFSTVKNSVLPAWKQDLENTFERAGRDQEKEVIMEQLRDLGYM